MPSPPDSFDLAASLDVIEHLEDDLQALRELRRIVAPGGALAGASEVAREIASRPQAALRGDRASCNEQWSLPLAEALRNEYRHGIAALASGEALGGLDRYASGQWRELPPERR